MSRNNSTGRRQVRPTALIYCEGAHDLAFMRYLKKVYSKESISSTNFTAVKGNGGSLDTIVKDALKVPGEFNRILIKLDNDRGKEELKKATDLKEKANKNGLEVTIVASKPCIDALLLSILNPSNNYSRKTSKSCKKDFHDNYIPSNKRLHGAQYERLFKRNIIEKARKKIKELDELIQFFQV